MTRVLNLECLQESCGGDQDFARELFSDLAGRALDLRRSLGAAAAEASPQGVRKSAHELKGSCLTLGAEKVASVCNHLENLGYENRMEGVPELLDELDRQLEALWACLASEGIYP